MQEWFVYVLVSSGGRTYTGIALNVERRLQEHNGEKPGGAKATRPWRPWEVGKVFGPFPSRSEAQKIEARIKKLRGKARLSFELDDGATS